MVSGECRRHDRIVPLAEHAAALHECGEYNVGERQALPERAGAGAMGHVQQRERTGEHGTQRQGPLFISNSITASTALKCGGVTRTANISGRAKYP